MYAIVRDPRLVICSVLQGSTTAPFPKDAVNAVVDVVADRHQHCDHDEALVLADCLLSSRPQASSMYVTGSAPPWLHCPVSLHFTL